MLTGLGIKRDIDTDHGDAMTDVETTGKRMRDNRVVKLLPAKAVVNEMDESMDEGRGCGLDTNEWVVQDWAKGLAEAREEEVKYMVGKLNIFEFCSEDAMRALSADLHEMGGRQEDEP